MIHFLDMTLRKILQRECVAAEKRAMAEFKRAIADAIASAESDAEYLRTPEVDGEFPEQLAACEVIAALSEKQREAVLFLVEHTHQEQERELRDVADEYVVEIPECYLDDD